MTALRKTPIALIPGTAPFAIRSEREQDVAVRETLLDACFGDDRQERTCQRLRDGHTPAEGLAFSAMREGRLVGTLRLWRVNACLLYTSPSPRDRQKSRMPSSA